MSELRKATHKLCNTCRYSMGFGSQPSNTLAKDRLDRESAQMNIFDFIKE